MKGFGYQNKSKEDTNKEINKSKEQIISQAFSFHAKGKIIEAEKLYKEFFKKGFQDHRVSTNYAIILSNRGAYKDAEKIIRHAIKLKPNLVEAHFNLGNILDKLYRLREAEISTRKAIELKPNFVAAYSNLGSILSKLNRLQEAELSCRKAIEINPNYIDAHLNLGIILDKLGKSDEGELTLLRAIKINPKYGKSYHQLNKFYNKKNEPLKAFKAISEAVKYDPNNHLIQGEFTRLKYKLGKYDEGENYANNLWNDFDDYFYEDNKSNILLISFGSMGAKAFDEDRIPSFNFYRLFENDKSFDKLFIRDIKREFYLNGLKNTTKNFQETIDLIKELTSVKNYRKIVAIGASAGGFAAILYGQLLNFSKVIAFNPQTVLSIEMETVLKDKTYSRLCANLRNLNISDTLYQNCLNLKNLIPFKTKVDLHCSNLSTVDKKHAEFIEHENCKLIKYQSSSHLIAQQLRESGKLKSIIEENLGL